MIERNIVIEIQGVEYSGTLLTTPTAQKIWDALPLQGQVNTWGEEIYFITSIFTNTEDDAKQEVDLGDLAFWPVANAFCLFFGKTPISTSNKPKAYSPVNVFGKVTSSLQNLSSIKDGDIVKVYKKE